MKVEIEDVLFWMDAVRNSGDRDRALESFWKGQVRSKVWLAEVLESYATPVESKIVIHGGWNGVLASILFNSNLNISEIHSYDIDPACEQTACTVNKQQEIQGRFRAITGDSTLQIYSADIVVNTICEHLTQEQYNSWLALVPVTAMIVLQSNNYFKCAEHIRCASTIKEFEEQSGIEVIHCAELETPLYTRFMLIGRKIV